MRPAGLIITVAVLAAGCGGSSEPAGAPETTATADVEAVESPTDSPGETPTPASTLTQPPRSQRGNAIKQIGETAYFTMSETDMTPFLEFQITEIAVTPECTGDYPEPPENGNFLIVDLAVSTATVWPEDLQGITIDFNPNDFSVIGEDGLTESALATAATYSCLTEQELLPSAGIGPGENVRGKVVLDSKSATGILVYRPWYGSGTGWEWTF